MTKDVDYYYNRLVYNFKKIGEKGDFYKSAKTKEYFKDIIRKVIDNNMEYLLTDSFICYIASYIGWYDKDLLWSTDINNEKFIEYICLYFELSLQFYSLPVGYFRYFKLLDEETKKATFKAYLEVENLHKFYSDIHQEDELWVSKTAIIVILARCFIINRMSDFSSICDFITNNVSFIVDDLNVNGIDLMKDMDKIRKRIIQLVEDKHNKIIR